MMAAETAVGAVKIVGYLEKKGKLKVVTTWKKYWFVLEGRLLLYYRSQDEYENLSPCKGSINMGLATNIMPGLAAAGVFQIITRTNTITLRAKERCVQEKWLQALLDASGQQTTSNPIKMSHFRYSMDDLIPTRAKAQQHQRRNLTRQNTLPNRFKNVNVERNNSIIERIRAIGGHTYVGSLDTINRVKNNKSSRLKTYPAHEETAPIPKMSEKRESDSNSSEVFQDNDIYNVVLTENTEYIPNSETDKDDFDLNKNCFLMENDQYIKSENRLPSEEIIDDAEYYCTYEEVNGTQQNIYNEPNLPRRPSDNSGISESDDGSVNEGKKESKFAKFARRLRNIKGDENGFKKRSTNFFMKLTGKKKICDDVTSEPVYDTVDYTELALIEQQRNKAQPENIVQTLLELQHTLNEKKTQIKELIEHTSTTASASKNQETDEADAEIKRIEEEKSEPKNVEERPVSDPEIIYPPGLPPRSGSKSRVRCHSPFHDVPKNNSPVLPSPTQLSPDYSIDKILTDLEKESKISEQQLNCSKQEELSVRQLIQKFNRPNTVNFETSEGINTDHIDVFLRAKGDNKEFNVSHIVNRYSDDLNKLLEELTKVTCAPLLTPGVTSSLVQSKSPAMTDEEWLAIAPIRRRRHSEPDYDVPRPHRSLQILPQSPDKDTDAAIPATRFFGPVLSCAAVKSVDPSISWRSMTPDSLEPLQILQAAIKKRENGDDMEQDRSMGYERSDVESEVEIKERDRTLKSEYLDSLEIATAF